MENEYQPASANIKDALGSCSAFPTWSAGVQRFVFVGMCDSASDDIFSLLDQLLALQNNAQPPLLRFQNALGLLTCLLEEEEAEPPHPGPVIRRAVGMLAFLWMALSYWRIREVRQGLMWVPDTYGEWTDSDPDARGGWTVILACPSRVPQMEGLRTPPAPQEKRPLSLTESQCESVARKILTHASDGVMIFLLSTHILH